MNPIPRFSWNFGPYVFGENHCVREAAIRELQQLEGRANALLCSLYKIPRHAFGRNADLLQNSEVVINDKHKLQIFLFAEGFKPDEIEIEEGDGQILVKGEHAERADTHGFIERAFVRKYLLPKDVAGEDIVSRLTPEGILVIEAVKHSRQPERRTTRSIPIQHMLPPT